MYCWFIKTTYQEETKETLFSLVYWNESVIPCWNQVESDRIIFYDEENDERQAADLDILDEKEGIIAIRIEAYKNRTSKAYNQWVIKKDVQIRDLVLKKVLEDQREKLNLKCEGPYKVTEKHSSKASYLEDKAGKKSNAYHWKKYCS